MARMNGERAIDISSIVLPDHVLRVLDRPSLSPFLSFSSSLSPPSPFPSLSLSLSLCRPGFSLSSRFSEIRRADNAKGPPPDERTRFALRSRARSRVRARHRHAPGRMDFRYVTGNPRRVYDYSLRDGNALVTCARAHIHTGRRAMMSAKYQLRERIA